MAAGAGVPDSHRGGHRPRCLRLAGGAVLSAAGGMVHGSPPRADGGGAPARRLTATISASICPFRRGCCLCAGGVYLAVQGVLRLLGRRGGQTVPATLLVAGAALPLRAFCDTGFRCRSRFRAGPWCWCGMPPPKAPCRPRWGLLIRLLFRRYRPASAGACAAVRPLHHRRGPLHPARRPCRPRVSPGPAPLRRFLRPPTPAGRLGDAGREEVMCSI